MDIIAIAPAPQQPAVVSQTSAPAATDGGSGFGRLLEQAVSSTADKKSFSDTPGGRQHSQGTPATRQQITDTGVGYTAAATTDALAIAADSATTAALNGSAVMNGLLQQSDAGLLARLFGRLTGEMTPTANGGWTATVAFPATAGQQPLSIDQVHAALPKQPDTLHIVINRETGVPLPAADGRSTDSILAGLQELIARNNDQVSLRASFNANRHAELPGYLQGQLVLAQTAQQTTATGLSGPTVEQAPIVALEPHLFAKSDPSGTSLRQENGAADLVSRAAVASSSGRESHNETAGGQTSNQQPSLGGRHAVTTVPPQGEQLHGSTIFANQFQETALQQGEAARPQTAMPANHYLSLVQEQNVVDQIIQRFSLQTRPHTNTINLRLHPAELGALKIEVVVKEDSLKAHIYAQTRQAQEIIEKHLPRLRGILEEQGLLIEDLLVTLQSDSLDEFSEQQDSSFSEQLTTFDDHQPPSNNGSFSQSLEDAASFDEQDPVGVNLTV